MTTTNTTEIETLTGTLRVTLGTMDDSLAPTSLRAIGGEILAAYYDGTTARYPDLDTLIARAKLADIGDEAVDAAADRALNLLERARTAPARAKAARERWIAEHVHQLPNGRWIVAQHHNGQWIASMTPRAQRVTGCSQVFARTLAGVNDGNVATYATRAGAVKASAESLEHVDAG